MTYIVLLKHACECERGLPTLCDSLQKLLATLRDEQLAEFHTAEFDGREQRRLSVFCAIHDVGLLVQQVLADL